MVRGGTRHEKYLSYLTYLKAKTVSEAISRLEEILGSVDPFSDEWEKIVIASVPKQSIP